MGQAKKKMIEEQIVNIELQSDKEKFEAEGEKIKRCMLDVIGVLKDHDIDSFESLNVFLNIMDMMHDENPLNDKLTSAIVMAMEQLKIKMLNSRNKFIEKTMKKKQRR